MSPLKVQLLAHVVEGEGVGRELVLQQGGPTATAAAAALETTLLMSTNPSEG